MENNALEKQQKYTDNKIPEAVINAAQQFGKKAASIAGDQIGKVTELTEKNVKRYPLAAVGIALGSGVLLGTLGTLLFRPKEPTMIDRFNDMKLGSRMRRLMKKYF